MSSLYLESLRKAGLLILTPEDVPDNVRIFFNKVFCNLVGERDFRRHSDFYELLAMGPLAAPLLLEKLSKGKRYSFIFQALKFILKDGPSDIEVKDSLVVMSEKWLGWAEKTLGLNIEEAVKSENPALECEGAEACLTLAKQMVPSRIICECGYINAVCITSKGYGRCADSYNVFCTKCNNGGGAEGFERYRRAAGISPDYVPPWAVKPDEKK